MELLGEYDFVKEFGEGVDRIFLEMSQAGLPDPVYRQNGFMLYAELRNKKWGNENISWVNTPQVTPQATPQAVSKSVAAKEQKLLVYCSTPRTRTEMMEFIGLTDRKYFRKQYLLPMLKSGQLLMTNPDKPNSPNQMYVAASNKAFN